jgi:protein-disulfide isomerase
LSDDIENKSIPEDMPEPPAPDSTTSLRPERITVKRSTYKKLVIGIVISLIAVSFFGGYVIGGQETKNVVQTIKTIPQTNPQPTSNPNQPQQTVKFQIPSFVPSRGSDSAQLNIVEFGDYQCPFCEKFFQEIEPQIKQDYIDTGKVKFYFLDYQFLGPDSETLGQGAWFAYDQGKYYDYHYYVYSHQGHENSGWATTDKVKTLATNISGLDLQKFNSCLDSKKYETLVQQFTGLGKKLGVSGTPTVFIGNDQKGYISVVGAQPYDVFKQVIDNKMS